MPSRGVIVPVVVVVVVTLVFQTYAVDVQQCKDDTNCVSNSTQNTTLNSTSVPPSREGSSVPGGNTTSSSHNASVATTQDDSVNRTASSRALNMTQLLQDLSLDDIDDTALASQSDKTAHTKSPTQDQAANLTSTEGPTTANDSVSITPAPMNVSALATVCMDDGTMRSEGERWHRGCEEACECRTGQTLCAPRCARPMFRRGFNADPNCVEKPGEDACCALLVCDSGLDMVESSSKKQCEYKNQTYREGETISDGCEAVCTCAQEGKVNCKPRCPTNNATASDRCLTLPDPTDPCCKVVLCDVTLGDHDVSKGSEEVQLHLLTAEVMNGTAVRLELAGATPENFTVEASDDQETWRIQQARGLLVTGLKPGKSVYLRVNSGTAVSNAVEVLLSTPSEGSADGCTYKGLNYTIGQEFHDGCEAFCMCTAAGVQCANIECPTDFGLDVLDPQCVTWENVPKDFVPSPPMCCPEKVQCKDNGSCLYSDQRFDNWAEIPISVTGCEKRCYCEFGKVSCQQACPPVTATPPPDMACPPGQALLSHFPGDDCCKYWQCPQMQQTGFGPPPTGFPPHGGSQPDEVTVQTLEPLDEHTIRLVFSVPPVLVGLHGRIELRYTADVKNMDETTWEQQVLAPPDDLIATQQLEFELGGLQPDTLYKIKIGVLLRDLHNSPSSPILTVRTLPITVPSTTLPPQIAVDAALELGQANATWALLRWRKFTENEMQFIDGVQLRYKELDGKVYAATPLIHRAVTTYTLEGLKPDTRYEVSIFFIPFPGQTTELQDERSVQIHTAQVQDLYAFSVEVVVHHVKSTSVEISWSGVPYPEDKYVNIFRAIYQSESGKEDLSSFKVAKRETQPKAVIMDLKPGTRYRLWLEVYLTNGRIKKSNVQDFITKPGSVPSVGATQQGKLELAEPTLEAGSYYGPLVAVAILAALAIVAALILLLILIRKYGQNKATISAHPRAAHQAAYDNPSYKVEIQQETMGTAHS